MTAETLLLVDDDPVLRRVLGRALTKRGFTVITAKKADEARRKAAAHSLGYAVVDLRLGDESGLALVAELRADFPRARILVLTGYASIATAIESIKVGATHYLAKPADAEAVITALHRDAPQLDIPVVEEPVSLEQLTWEHLQRVLHECDGNVSKAARRLNMHRRTLQRKLQKPPCTP